MLLLCLLFFSASQAFDYYSLTATTAAAKVFDNKTFNLGFTGYADFKAYSEFFYTGIKIGLTENNYSDPLSRENLEQAPILLTIGTAHTLTDGGETIEGKRYHLGLGLGFTQGTLNRTTQSPLNNPSTTKYQDLRFCFALSGGMDFNILDLFFIGPSLEYRTGTFTFKDEAFSGNMFMREYSGSSLNIGLNITYFWGMF